MAEWGSFNDFFARNNAGQSFNTGFNQGQDRRREADQQNALGAYARNPNDPDVVNALSGVDPSLAIKIRQQQEQASSAKHEKDTGVIATLARDAKDPESFDAAVDQVVAMGYPEAAQFKGKFSPALRSALMAAGGIKDDDGRQPSALIQGYQFRQNLPESERPGFDRYQQNARPQIIGNAESGFSIYDPNASAGQSGGPQPGTIEDGYRFKGGDPSQPENWEPVQGGPTPQASGGFRPEGY